MVWTAFSNIIIFARHLNQGRQPKSNTPRSTIKAEKGALGVSGGTETTGWLRGSTEVQDLWWLTTVGKECHLQPPHHASHSYQRIMTQRMKRRNSTQQFYRKGLLENQGCIQQPTQPSHEDSAPILERLRSINIAINCNGIYQRIHTLCDYTAIFLSSAYS